MSKTGENVEKMNDKPTKNRSNGKTEKTASKKSRNVTQKAKSEKAKNPPTREELKARYIEEIKKSSLGVKTYKKEFDPIIETLAQILVDRDAAQNFYELQGGQPVVEHSGRDGINLRQSPALKTIIELNHSALEYWRELGLTPKSLKALNEEMNKTDKPEDFSAMISNLISG